MPVESPLGRIFRRVVFVKSLPLRPIIRNPTLRKGFVCDFHLQKKGPCSSPGKGRRVVFFDNTLHSHSASLHPGV